MIHNMISNVCNVFLQLTFFASDQVTHEGREA